VLQHGYRGRHRVSGLTKIINFQDGHNRMSSACSPRSEVPLFGSPTENQRDSLDTLPSWHLEWNICITLLYSEDCVCLYHHVTSNKVGYDGCRKDIRDENSVTNKI
jgi:hypothetical protein